MYTPEPKYSHTFDSVRVPDAESALHLEDKPSGIRERLYTRHGIYGPLFEWRTKFPDDSAAGVVDFENMVHGYWGTILSVDDSVAKVLAYLKESKQLDNTIVVVMGDNGLLEGDDGMVDKRTAHEASLRIPLLVRYPGLVAGKEITPHVLPDECAPTLPDPCREPPGQDTEKARPPRKRSETK